MGGPITEQLDQKLRQTQGDSNEIIRGNARHQLYEISAGLASSWNMGSMLQLSLKIRNAVPRVTGHRRSQYI